MGSSHGSVKLSEISEEKIQELFDFLAYGEIPKGLYIKKPPKLGARKAFSIIYFSQEETGVLPDKWELCKQCKSLYDSYTEGSNGHCDNCKHD